MFVCICYLGPVHVANAENVGRPCGFVSRSPPLVVANIDPGTFPSFVRPFFSSLLVPASVESLATTYRSSSERQKPTVLAAIALVALVQA